MIKNAILILGLRAFGVPENDIGQEEGKKKGRKGKMEGREIEEKMEEKEREGTGGRKRVEK